MEKNDITVYITEKTEKSKTSVIPLFINCIISIFSLCFSADIFCFFHILIHDELLEKFLFVIMAGLVLTFIAALRFSFFSFIKTLAEKYHLLLILGIKAKDFWRLAVKEYFSEVFLLGIKAILYSNVVCIAITYFIFRSHATINFMMAFKQFFLTVLLVFLLYTAVLSLTMAAIMYHRRKKSLIEFFDQFSQELSKGHTGEKGQLLKPVSGAAFLILSFLLLIDFRVEKMILAVFINIFGAFLLIHSDGDLIKGGIKKFKHMYYKKILVWGDLLYQYKVNSHLIFILYTLNFFLVYFMGGLILSVDSGEVSEKYPYETIIYSDINLYPQNTYHVLSVNIPGYGSAAAISNEDYNKLMKTECSLEAGNVLFLDEREKGASSPLTAKEITLINKASDEATLNYTVEKAEWNVIFGQNIFQELNGIVIFNNRDFDLLSESRAGVDKYIFLSEQAVNRENFDLNADTKYWSRTRHIEKEQTENSVVITLVYMISLILILQGQAFIFIKQVVNLREESHRCEILKQLGIRSTDLEELMDKKIKGILMVPGILAILNGFLFFAMDICQEPGGITLRLLLKYGIVIMIFAFIQIFGCCLISKKVRKIYMNES